MTMHAESKVYKLKVILLGDAGVGKTSITLRFTSNSFDENYKSTLGGKFALGKFIVVHRRMNANSHCLLLYLI